MKKILAAFFLLISYAAYSQPGNVYVEEVEIHRLEKDAEFRDSLDSPLDEKDKLLFTGLKYFPVDSSYRVKAVFTPFKKQKKFLMKTSTDRLPEYRKYGTLTFTINGRKFTLHVYQNVELVKKPGYENHLFIPFTDLTNGDESYGGGRYLDFRIPDEKEVWLDFNMAYNPYCSYSSRYSCPVPPEENFLDTRIEAGEKNFAAH